MKNQILPDGDFDFILIGNADGVLINLPKSFRASDFKTLVIGVPGMSLISSPDVDAALLLTSSSQSVFLSELFTISKYLMNLKGTFLWCSDEIMREVAEFDIPLELKIKLLPVKNPEYFGMLGSKISQHQKISELGINYPKSYSIISSEDHLSQEFFARKMIVKADNSAGGTQVKTLESMEDFSKIPRKWFPVLLQEFLTGERVTLEVYYRKGKLIYCLYSTVKYSSKKYSPSISRRYFTPTNLDFIEPLIALGESAQIDGFVSASLLVDLDTSEHLLFEFDMRPNVWHHTYIDFTSSFFDLWHGDKEFSFEEGSLLQLKYEPRRLYGYLLKKWKLLSALKVINAKPIHKFGTPISSTFYDSENRVFNIIKLVTFPVAPFKSMTLFSLRMVRSKMPDALKVAADRTPLKVILNKVLGN